MQNNPFRLPWFPMNRSVIYRPIARGWPAALVLAAGVAVAQTATSYPAQLAVPAFDSVFDEYRKFDDQPVSSWREANDTVGRIGGWRAYAREAHQPEATGAESAPGPHPVPGATSGNAADGHAGHHGGKP
jgi:hypothetical protein